MDARAIGVRVRVARERAGLNQEELSEAVGMSRAYIYRLEAGGIINPKLFDLQAIATALQVPLDDLLYDALVMTDAERRELDMLRKHPEFHVNYLNLAKTFDEMDDADKRGLLEALRLFARYRGISTDE